MHNRRSILVAQLKFRYMHLLLVNSSSYAYSTFIYICNMISDKFVYTKQNVTKYVVNSSFKKIITVLWLPVPIIKCIFFCSTS